MLQRRLQHVRIDQHGQHAQRLVVLDEAHAAHVGGQVVNLHGALGGRLAVFLEIQIEGEILDVVEALVPFVERLDVHRANVAVALLAQQRDQRAANKTARASH